MLAVLVVEAGRPVSARSAWGTIRGLTIERSEVLFAVVGFGFLGLIDDLLGGGTTRGLPRARACARGTARSRPGS